MHGSTFLWATLRVKRRNSLLGLLPNMMYTSSRMITSPISSSTARLIPYLRMTIRRMSFIYLKSTPKLFSPGWRICIAVIPVQLAETYRLYKKQDDIDSSMLSQADLEIYLRSGMFYRHLAKIRSRYVSRGAKLLDAALARRKLPAAVVPSLMSALKNRLHTHILLHKFDEL